ncbi:hypothetical protein DFS34DRAFT_47115 [Phlyctochytrium arcticum]|nr:hypothetical protein DFS34DRAFT_47115 [Phlyctochytrium arcticum]
MQQQPLWPPSEESLPLVRTKVVALLFPVALIDCNFRNIGRVWKTPQVTRHSSMRPKMLRQGWAKQQEDRKRREIIKTIEKEIKDTKDEEKKAKREAEKERLKRKEENEKRAEVVQQVSAAKMKRMKKKQLRLLRKV